MTKFFVLALLTLLCIPVSAQTVPDSWSIEVLSSTADMKLNTISCLVTVTRSIGTHEEINNTETTDWTLNNQLFMYQWRTNLVTHLTAGELNVTNAIVRLNTIAVGQPVAWPPRFDQRITTNNAYHLSVLVKIPKGYHYVPSTTVVSPPAIVRPETVVAGDATNPTVLDVVLPEIRTDNTGNQRYAVSFVIARDVPLSLKKNYNKGYKAELKEK